MSYFFAALTMEVVFQMVERQDGGAFGGLGLWVSPGSSCCIGWQQILLQ